jgi:uncharacterized membrane protein
MPVCSRCTGIYLGFIFSLLILLAFERKIKASLPGRKIIITLIMLFGFMVIDAALNFLRVITANNIVRFVTGYSVGWFLVLVLLPLKNSIIFCKKFLCQKTYLDKKPNFIIWLFASILIALSFILTYKKTLMVWSIFSILGLLVFISFIVYILFFALIKRLSNSVCSPARYILFFIISVFISAGFIALSSVFKSFIHPYFRF